MVTLPVSTYHRRFREFLLETIPHRCIIVSRDSHVKFHKMAEITNVFPTFTIRTFLRNQVSTKFYSRRKWITRRRWSYDKENFRNVKKQRILQILFFPYLKSIKSARLWKSWMASMEIAPRYVKRSRKRESEESREIWQTGKFGEKMFGSNRTQ